MAKPTMLHLDSHHPSTTPFSCTIPQSRPAPSPPASLTSQIITIFLDILIPGGDVFLRIYPKVFVFSIVCCVLSRLVYWLILDTSHRVHAPCRVRFSCLTYALIKYRVNILVTVYRKFASFILTNYETFFQFLIFLKCLVIMTT